MSEFDSYSIEVYPGPKAKLFVSTGFNEVLEALEHLGYDYIAATADEDTRTPEEKKAAIKFMTTLPGLSNHYEAD